MSLTPLDHRQRTMDLGFWLDESAVESPESRVEETWVEEMTQIERFEDIEAQDSQESTVRSRKNNEQDRKI